ncbi:SDR family oxidoreductase [Actinophytocola sp.]|jgi:3-oxoacyl-[acyl-carrier protein] reductase|uniref:SDR family NAD(P)-dependent oxidoreductase n=1 Tax=Actinophytocola sp. TaxID=1872138 RepID=UPI002EDA5FBE
MGPVTVITGASSPVGIGRATALLLAEQGHRLALLDVDEDGLAEAAKLCRDLGAEAITARCDVSSTSNVDDAIGAALAHYGRVDCLVANAGIARRKDFVDLTDADWEETLSVNLGGVWRCARAVLPGMLERNDGSIVAVSSLRGYPWGWAHHVHYSASKAAIEGLVRALAVEVGPRGVRVNGVSPGFVRTNQSLDPVNSAGEEGMRRSVGYIPLRRIGEPDDIAATIAFLCSAAGRYVAGQNILVDGGLTLGDLSPLEAG